MISDCPSYPLHRKGLRLRAASFVLCAILLPAVLLAGNTVPERPPWRTSKVRGTPEPLTPYRVERVFPSLKFQSPLLMARVPDTDRLVVAEQSGRILTFSESQPADGAEPFIETNKAIPGASTVYGVAFHPEFAENHYVFLCYTAHGDFPTEEGTRVSRFDVAFDSGGIPRCRPESEKNYINWVVGGHNGGCLQFGPLDGYLYISTGDAAGPSPPDGRDTGQDNSDLLSAILRIDIDRSAGDLPYAIPDDNPLISFENARPEVWSFGFRNPWKITFDPVSGALWAADVGWELWEMVIRVERGGNYGWSIKEGNNVVRPNLPRGETPILPPTVDHSHTEARSITGGRVYYGDRLPELRGAYIYADYETGKIWALKHDGTRVTSLQEIADSTLKVSAFGLGREDELYIVDHIGGQLYRLKPRAADDRKTEFPKQLSESGLFSDLESLTPSKGVVPYSVVAEPWTDHAVATRHLAVPGTARILAGGAENWTYPPGTVVVKTLSLALDASQPNAVTRLETQLLHYEREEWRAYTYAWDDEQTEATLVPSEGQDRVVRIRDTNAAGGERQQTWRYASRTECILCHNSFGFYLLGMSVPQLDTTHDYPDGTARQLERWRRTRLLIRPDAKKDSGGEKSEEEPVNPSPTLVSPWNEKAPLATRARSYLHANCAPCHRFNGGGNAALEVPYDRPLDGTRTVDEKPRLGEFGIPDARVIAPGNPYRSVICYRMASLGSARMPRVGSRVVDQDGLQLVAEWIRSLDQDSAADDAPLEAAISALKRTGTASRDLNGATDTLLETTAGALRVVEAIDAGEIPADRREGLIKAAHTQPDVAVRDLFIRYLDEEERAERLGESFDPVVVLELKGDPARGRKVFEQETTRCASCHEPEVATGTPPLGPNLCAPREPYTRRQILENILEPSKKVDPPYQAYLLLTARGETHSGLLLQQDDQEVLLKDAAKNLVRVSREDIAQLAPQTASLMPTLLLRDLTAQQAADLIEYIISCGKRS